MYREQKDSIFVGGIRNNYNHQCSFNPLLITVGQPRKKWGKELVIGESSRPDNVLTLLASANSTNFQDVFTFD